MSDVTRDNAAATTQFEELPDAPPQRKLKFSVVGRIAIALVTMWVVIAFIGPFISPYSEADIIADDGFTVPGETCSEYEEGACYYFLLGTDYLGRDIFSRILWGARTTLGISFAATVLAYVVGVILGITAAISAIGGGRLDMCLSRFYDAFISIPHIMLGLVIIAAIGSSIPILIVASGFIYSATVFRVSRALGLDVMVTDFVEAARARGEGLWWIIRREIFPNIAMPLATDFGLRLVFIILFISSLSFLGLGVQPPMSDWGSMVRENLQGLVYGSWAPIAPAIAIALLTIPINLIVDDVSAYAGGRLARRMI
jgi:peptide/nickel transport system permease protein